MSDRLITGTPHLSPDSFRMSQQMLKQYYDQHVKRSVGYKDMDGLPYVGITENFGSEMLVETRKMRLKRPPLDWVHLNSTFQQYFDLQYADFINTYDQQNLIMACVIPNTMIDLGSQETYRVKFTNVQELKVIRAAADGDETSVVDTFLKTFDNPVLLIDDVEYPLYVNDQSNAEHNVTYYFALNHMTTDLIDTYDDGTLITVDMKKFNEIPFIWFTLQDFRTYPPFALDPTANEDVNGDPLLTIGSNGQHQHCLYPLMYGEENLPYSAETTPYWYLKVEGDFTDLERIYNDKVYELNLTALISKIRYVQFADEDTFQTTPLVNHEITFTGSNVKVTLNHVNGTPWIFHRPVEGDYDYDGETYVNNVYALIPIDAFLGNVPFEDHQSLTPAFHVIFNDEYYDPSETMINHMRAGLHLDYTTDYSDHSVEKKFGIVYGLSDFGGLPEYYSRFLDRSIHHAHAELYAIRDDANVRNQKPTDKQTAAIILESGIPDNDIKEITADMDPVIVYAGNRTYNTDASAIVSSVNFLSNIGYYNNHTLPDVTAAPQYQTLQKFVYHGNRTFSTGIIEFDPMLEFGRGYLISNDGTKYENNAKSSTPRAARTAARICDIPTAYEQLENITGVSPTVVIDTKYVSQKASYTDDIFNKIWNQLSSKWYLISHSTASGIVYNFAPHLADLPDTIGTANGTVAIPPEKKNHLTIEEFTDTLSVGTPGTDYTTSSEFGFNIGGMFFRGTVNDVVAGGINEFEIELDPSRVGDDPLEIPIANFNARESSIPVSTTSGTGSGAVLTCSIPQAIWDANAITVTDTHDGVYTYVKDERHEGMFIVPYTDDDGWDTEHMIQLTGDIDVGNVYYDNQTTRDQRTTRGTYLYNMLRYLSIVGNGFDYSTATPSFIVSRDTVYPLPLDSYGITAEALSTGADLHEAISNVGMNTWDCFVTALPETPNPSSSNYKVITWEKEYRQPNGSFAMNMLFPKNSDLALNIYHGNWNGIKLAVDDQNVIPLVYDIMYTKDKGVRTYTASSAGISLVNKSDCTLSTLVDNNANDTYDQLYYGSTMNYNLYRFNQLARCDEVDEMRRYLNTLDSNTIYSMIVEKFGDNNYVTKYYSFEEKPYVADTAYSAGDRIIDVMQNLYAAQENFTATTVDSDVSAGHMILIGKSKKDILVDYYIMNDYPAYDKINLSLFKRQGDSTLISDDTPIGSAVPIRHLAHSFVNISGSTPDADKLQVLRLEADIQDLSSFRMYDNGEDISDHVLLILNEHAYTFDGHNWVLKH